MTDRSIDALCMDNSVISSTYDDSQEHVKAGDLVLLDGHPGRVEGVFMPGTSQAADCHCEDTGALSILFDDGISVIYPFGHLHVFTKQPVNQ